MTDSNFLHACDPPWIVFPELKSEELSQHLKQGHMEPWFDRQWRPFWAALSMDQKAEYLNFWNATPEWRDTVEFFFDKSWD